MPCGVRSFIKPESGKEKKREEKKRKGKEREGNKMKGKEMKGREWKGKERKNERKGKERQENHLHSLETITQITQHSHLLQFFSIHSYSESDSKLHHS